MVCEDQGEYDKALVLYEQERAEKEARGRVTERGLGFGSGIRHATRETIGGWCW